MAESLSIMVAAKLLPLPNVHQDNKDLQLGIVLGLNLLALLLKLVYYTPFFLMVSSTFCCTALACS